MRLLAAAIVLLAPRQSGDELSETLKRDGWKAVEAAVTRGESSRIALQTCAGGKDADVSFFARAAVAELDAAREGDMALLATKAPSDGSPSPLFVFRKFHTWLEKRYRVDLNRFDPGPASYVQFSGRIVTDGGPAVSRRIKVELLDGIDDQGRRLGTPSTTLEYMPGGESLLPGIWYSFGIATPPDSRNLERVRLRIELTCERKRGEIAFDELAAANQEKQLGAVTVKLVSFLPSSGGEHQVTLEARGDPGHPWLDHKGIRLEGAEGKDWVQRGAYIGNKTDRVVYQFYYDDPGGAGKPKRLRFPAVTETYVRKVYAEFRQVPLQ